MKKILLVFICAFLSVYSFSQDYKYEKKVYKKLINVSTKLGVNLDTEFLRFEAYLIDENILENNSGQGYYDLMQRLINDTSFNCNFDYSFRDTLDKYYEIEKGNKQALVSLKQLKADTSSRAFKNSRLAELKESNSISKYSKKPPLEEMSHMIAMLTPQDFEQPLFKIFGVIALKAFEKFNALNQLTSIDIKVDSSIDSVAKIRADIADSIQFKKLSLNYTDIHLYIIDADSLIFHGEKIAVTEVANAVKNLLYYNGTDSTMPPRKFIDIPLIGHFSVMRLNFLVHYKQDDIVGHITKVNSGIIEAIMEIRDVYSKEYFFKTYVEITDAQKAAINQIVPYNITTLNK